MAQLVSPVRLLVLLTLLDPILTALDSCPKSCICVIDETDCHNRNLQTIPNEDFRTNTQTLLLQNNNITKVSQFKNLNDLRKIDLSNNSIKSIEPLAFFESGKLEEMDFSFNKLEMWDKSWVQSLTKLERVDFAGNIIANLPAYTFSDTSNIRLTFANFSSNGIVKMDDNAFYGMVSLIEIDLSVNYLSTLKAKTFETLTNLKKLNLAGNLIRFPSANEWPVLIAPKLEALSLANNYIQSSNRSLNWFETPEMTSLDLSHNEISELPLRPLDYLHKLETIYLGANGFPSVPIHAFRGSLSRSLRHIHITQCPQLTVIENGAFSNLVGLTGLHIAGNPRLAKLPAELAISNMKALDVSDNKLQTLPETLIQWADIETESSVNFDGNPWHCDCGMKWIKGYSFARNMICATPTNATGKPAANLPLDGFVCSDPPVKKGSSQRLYLSITLVVVSVCCGLLVLAIVFRRVRCPGFVRSHYRTLMGVYDPLEETGSTVVHFSKDGQVTTNTYDETVKAGERILNV